MRRFPVLLIAGAAAFGAVYWFTHLVHRPTDQPVLPGMVWIPGGEFTMGTDSDLAWPDEKPSHRVRVDGFWIDETEVTNAQLAEFVAATGYVTTAGKPVNLGALMKQLN